MRRDERAARALVLVVLFSGIGVGVASAGDSLYGKVTEVRSADVVVLDYGSGQYVVRLVGIQADTSGLAAGGAKEMVRKLVLGKNVRIRFGGRNANDEMVSQLLTDDPVDGIKDVGLELLRAGLVHRMQGEDHEFGYKYNELSLAESEARTAKRGLWAPAPPPR
jgi:endonuclease YncB( thermonuclease family)